MITNLICCSSSLAFKKRFYTLPHTVEMKIVLFLFVYSFKVVSGDGSDRCIAITQRQMLRQIISNIPSNIPFFPLWLAGCSMNATDISGLLPSGKKLRLLHFLKVLPVYFF